MTDSSSLPRIIQGGMGIAVSDWRLANAVCRAGQLGVVSGTALDTVFVRRLQDGDPGGHLRRALAHFPIAGAATTLLGEWFRPDGRAPDEPYRLLPMYRRTVSDARQLVTVAANFAEIWLAKEGHDRPVGLNLLTKVQLPTLPSLYGAMLAEVDVVIMGAGIPREIPGALDALAEHRPAALKLDHDGPAAPEPLQLTFAPAGVGGTTLPPLRRPLFFPIVSAASLATTLLRRSNGRVDGFIVEGPTAGGHNAPPRGAMQLNERGEPVYGPRDAVDLEAMRALGVPFWLAGGYGTPDKLAEALAAGAAGVQVGTLFAGSDESGLAPTLRTQLLDAVARDEADVFTDPLASPTGYPFKRLRTGRVEHAEGPHDDAILEARERVCDLGYLRQPVRAADGRVLYRCAAEPVDQFVAKGGDAAATLGRRCLCNGLLADIGLPQRRAGGDEPALLTCGDDLQGVATLAAPHGHYRAIDAVRWLEGITDGERRDPR
jgi:NAD(P)H-dependent flavin oxidoreductase YrpB (nitropropane dioxygenase family)